MICFIATGTHGLSERGEIRIMNEQDAVELLKKAEQFGIDVWLDGGWGIDALVGRQTRPHHDIDVFIEKRNAAIFLDMIATKGYREIQMKYTTESHTVWRDADDRIIDLHLFEFGETEVLYFENEAYPSDVFDGKGRIGNMAVRCLTAEAQLRFHHGYETTDKDWHDVLILCKTFGLSIPAEYADVMNKT